MQLNLLTKQSIISLLQESKTQRTYALTAIKGSGVGGTIDHVCVCVCDPVPKEDIGGNVNYTLKRDLVVSI